MLRLDARGWSERLSLSDKAESMAWCEVVAPGRYAIVVEVIAEGRVRLLTVRRPVEEIEIVTWEPHGGDNVCTAIYTSERPPAAVLRAMELA